MGVHLIFVQTKDIWPLKRPITIAGQVMLAWTKMNCTSCTQNFFSIGSLFGLGYSTPLGRVRTLCSPLFNKTSRISSSLSSYSSISIVKTIKLQYDHFTDILPIIAPESHGMVSNVLSWF